MIFFQFLIKINRIHQYLKEVRTRADIKLQKLYKITKHILENEK